MEEYGEQSAELGGTWMMQMSRADSSVSLEPSRCLATIRSPRVWVWCGWREWVAMGTRVA